MHYNFIQPIYLLMIDKQCCSISLQVPAHIRTCIAFRRVLVQFCFNNLNTCICWRALGGFWVTVWPCLCTDQFQGHRIPNLLWYPAKDKRPIFIIIQIQIMLMYFVFANRHSHLHYRTLHTNYRNTINISTQKVA